jgi:hypothetical protein
MLVPGIDSPKLMKQREGGIGMYRNLTVKSLARCRVKMEILLVLLFGAVIFNPVYYQAIPQQAPIASDDHPHIRAPLGSIV